MGDDLLSACGTINHGKWLPMMHKHAPVENYMKTFTRFEKKPFSKLHDIRVRWMRTVLANLEMHFHWNIHWVTICIAIIPIRVLFGGKVEYVHRIAGVHWNVHRTYVLHVYFIVLCTQIKYELLQYIVMHHDGHISFSNCYTSLHKHLRDDDEHNF